MQYHPPSGCAGRPRGAPRKDRRRPIGLALVSLLAALAFPTAGLAANCEGDDCQVPPPPPAEVIPATSVVEGPGNPPVRFEGEGKPGKHHKPKRPHHKKPHRKKPGKKDQPRSHR